MQKSRSVAGLVERLSHSTYGDGYKDGLKPAQWAALRYFSNANRFSKTASAFARYQGITLGAASQTIGALVKKQLLNRTRDKVDRRQYNLCLTSKADKLKPADPILALVDAAFELDEGERVTTTAALEKMLMNLLREKGGAYFGHCNNCRYLQCIEAKSRQKQSFRCANFEQELTSEDLKKICINFGRV